MIILLITVLGRKLVFEDALIDDAESQGIAIYTDHDRSIHITVLHIQSLAFQVFQDTGILQRQIQHIVILFIAYGFCQGIGCFKTVMG